MKKHTNLPDEIETYPSQDWSEVAIVLLVAVVAAYIAYHLTIWIL